jgi:hypothetical protein
MIESREMAESQKKIFDMIWKGTGEYDRQITDHYEKIFQQRFLDLQKLQKQKNDEVK